MSKLLDAITKEINLFEENVKKFRTGVITPETFQRIRLQHGVYGQRQDGVQMIRIKIPLGILTADQVECIADLAETIAHNNAHITTRQDIQIHYVKLENTPDLMRKLEAVGLTTREACGNTVRNVTASPSAGVDPKEAFDVTPYALAMTYHLLRNPINQNLPRKFKIAFDGGGVMTALPMMHEIGLIARVRDGKRGFEVFIGGGLGSSPRIAKLLDPFMPAEELIPWAESTLRLFDRIGERKVRMKARMKFLIDKFGFEKFKQMIVEERKSLEVNPSWNSYLKNIEKVVETAPKVNDKDIPKVKETSDPEYIAWEKTNVWEQKQKGYSMVEIRLTTGDMTPKQMRPLANILRRYAGGKVRTIVHQNLLIRWVRNQDLPTLYQELKSIQMVKKDAQTLYDITACPGTDTCRLGIASSMGLARVIEARLYQENGNISSVAKDLRIKISGCPNSCGQHHLANIGFYGGALPIDGRVVPAFQLILGGNYGREMALGQMIAQIPSKNVPDSVLKLVTHFVQKRKSSESFNDFYRRLGKEKIIQLLGDLLQTPSYEKKPDFYKDWEGEEEFALQKGVIGECAGAMVDNAPPRVSDGDKELQTAEALLSHGNFEAAGHKAYEAMVKSAEGLLYYRFVQTFNDVEATHEFENHFVKLGVCPELKGFHKEIQALRQKKIDENLAKDWLNRARSFIKLCHSKEAQVASTSARKSVPNGLQPDNLAI